jgi:hypothetical protein
MEFSYLTMNLTGDNFNGKIKNKNKNGGNSVSRHARTVYWFVSNRFSQFHETGNFGS